MYKHIVVLCTFTTFLLVSTCLPKILKNCPILHDLPLPKHLNIISRPMHIPPKAPIHLPWPPPPRHCRPPKPPLVPNLHDTLRSPPCCCSRPRVTHPGPLPLLQAQSPNPPPRGPRHKPRRSPAPLGSPNPDPPPRHGGSRAVDDHAVPATSSLSRHAAARGGG